VNSSEKLLFPTPDASILRVPRILGAFPPQKLTLKESYKAFKYGLVSEKGIVECGQRRGQVQEFTIP
jgi:hypothetical protein